MEPNYPDMTLETYRVSTFVKDRKDWFQLTWQTLRPYQLNSTALNLCVLCLEQMLIPTHSCRTRFLPRLNELSELVHYTEIQSCGEYSREISRLRNELLTYMQEYVDSDP
jgi:hypothetical protein